MSLVAKKNSKAKRQQIKEKQATCETKAGLVSETSPSFASSFCWSL